MSDQTEREAVIDRVKALADEWWNVADHGEDERYGRIIARTLRHCADELHEALGGCCGACQGSGYSLSDQGMCWDCRGTGHPHTPTRGVPMSDQTERDRKAKWVDAFQSVYDGLHLEDDYRIARKMIAVADQEQAELRAEVQHWKHHAWEAGEGFKRAVEGTNRAHAYRRAAEVERDVAQERLRAVELDAATHRYCLEAIAASPAPEATTSEGIYWLTEKLHAAEARVRELEAENAALRGES